ncbi:MAG: hypothetical protein GX833_08565 [Clostridium sp.]|jgi:flagellar biosynthesis component FlhA|nr:hypothetical protein [Clostridium sp.]
MKKIHLIIIAIVILTFIIEPGMGIMALLIGGIVLSFDIKRRRIQGANPRPFSKENEQKEDQRLEDQKLENQQLEDDKKFV